MLPHRDHRKLLDIEIDRHRDQIRIMLALHDFLGSDRLALEEMNGRRVLQEDQPGAFCLPSFFTSTLLKVPIVPGGIVNPYPR